MATDDRSKALDAALSQIEKQFGKDSIMRMGENMHFNIESIPTGALAFVSLKVNLPASSTSGKRSLGSTFSGLLATVKSSADDDGTDDEPA